MIEAFWKYLRDFRDGKITFVEFNATMSQLLELVDEANNALDSTWMHALADEGTQARAFIGMMVGEYEASPELFAQTYVEK